MSESDFQLKTGHKIAAALIPISGSAFVFNSYFGKIEELQTKVTQQEIKIYYIEKKIEELDQFRKWCEEIYKQYRWQKKRRD